MAQNRAPTATPDKRAHVIATARALFAEHGYEKTTLGDVSREAGILPGSLYHLFPAKERLLHAVLEQYLAGLWPVVMEPAFSRTSDPIKRVLEVLRDYRQRVIDSQFRYRCPIGSLALEVANEDGAARALIAENFNGWRVTIERCFHEAGFPRRRADKAALATFVLSVMEGGVMQAHALQSIEPFDQSVEQLRNYFKLLNKERRQT